MRLTEVGTPVTTSNRNNAELGDDDSSTDGSRDFLGGLDTEANVALTITDDNDGLEAGTLTGTGLLLDRLDLFGCVRPRSSSIILVFEPTFITSSLSLGRKKSTIWYSLIGREWR